jgi:glycine betaine/proline transport system substrate-binding protein
MNVPALVRIAAAAALTGTASGAMAAGTAVVIGVPNFPTAEVTANIIGQVLEAHYGADVTLKPSGTAELFDAIDRGEADIHPEVWLPNGAVNVAEYTEEKKTLSLAPATVIATQNVCTTRETVEKTGITAVADLAKPEMAAKFDTDGDGMGEMWIGATGWAATPVERVRAKSYGYDKTMTLLEMPEDVAMAAVDAAAATGAPIVFYCYGPHHLFALHDVVRLKEPIYDASAWRIVKPSDDPRWLDESSAATAWQPSFYHVGYRTAFGEAHPEVASFLQKMRLTDADAEAMSYAVDVERRDPEEVAGAWIAANAEKIEEWTR